MAIEWTAAMVAAQPDDGQRREVLDGALAVTPAPSWRHQDVALAFWRILDAYVAEYALGRALAAPADVEFSPYRLVGPDVFVVPNTAAGGRATRFADVKHLLLVVEVVSSSPAGHDRGEKREIYMQENVDEYWIVDADAWCVERWRRGDESPEIVRQTLGWHPDASVAALLIDLPALVGRAIA